jgi:hypothetical protein
VLRLRRELHVQQPFSSRRLKELGATARPSRQNRALPFQRGRARACRPSGERLRDHGAPAPRRGGLQQARARRGCRSSPADCPPARPPARPRACWGRATRSSWSCRTRTPPCWSCASWAAAAAARRGRAPGACALRSKATVKAGSAATGCCTRCAAAAARAGWPAAVPDTWQLHRADQLPPRRPGAPDPPTGAGVLVFRVIPSTRGRRRVPAAAAEPEQNLERAQLGVQGPALLAGGRRQIDLRGAAACVRRPRGTRVPRAGAAQLVVAID